MKRIVVMPETLDLVAPHGRHLVVELERAQMHLNVLHVVAMCDYDARMFLQEAFLNERVMLVSIDGDAFQRAKITRTAWQLRFGSEFLMSASFLPLKPIVEAAP